MVGSRPAVLGRGPQVGWLVEAELVTLDDHVTAEMAGPETVLRVFELRPGQGGHRRLQGLGAGRVRGRVDVVAGIDGEERESGG